MPGQSENERRLDRVQSDFKEMQSDIKEIKEFLIGNPGNDGIFTRMTKFEERQGFFSVCYGWLLAGFVGLSAGLAYVTMLVISLFRDQK